MSLVRLIGVPEERDYPALLTRQFPSRSSPCLSATRINGMGGSAWLPPASQRGGEGAARGQGGEPAPVRGGRAVSPPPVRTTPPGGLARSRSAPPGQPARQGCPATRAGGPLGRRARRTGWPVGSPLWRGCRYEGR